MRLVLRRHRSRPVIEARGGAQAFFQHPVGQRVRFGGGSTGSGFVPRSRQVVQVGQSIVEPHLDGRLAVVADGEPGPVAGYVHRRMLGRVGEGELHRARNRALGAERCTGWAANLISNAILSTLLIFHDR